LSYAPLTPYVIREAAFSLIFHLSRVVLWLWQLPRAALRS